MTPTKIVYFGGYDLFSKKIEDSGNKIQGYLLDELEDENRNLETLEYVGAIGEYVAYIKCGVSECDVYYTEILAG